MEVVIGLLMLLQFHDCLEMLTKTLKLLRLHIKEIQDFDKSYSQLFDKSEGFPYRKICEGTIMYLRS